MTEKMEIGTPPIPLRIRRSARARRYSLRISAVDGAVSLTVPKRAALDEALAFARSKEDWLRGHLEGRPQAVVVAPGVVLPVDGRPVTVCAAGQGQGLGAEQAQGPGQGRRVRLEGDRLLVPGRPEGLGGRVRGFLQTRARDRLSAASDRYAAALGCGYDRITLRDTRSRWGSCTSDGGLMYSWRLVLAPPEVLDYVAAHEVAHLRELNHSAAFWALVERLEPDYRQQRDWLRRHGSGLHCYRFG